MVHEEDYHWAEVKKKKKKTKIVLEDVGCLAGSLECNGRVDDGVGFKKC